MKIFTRVNIVFVWTTKPRKYKNDEVKTLNRATVSDVSRTLNKYALARVCLITNKHCARNKSKISEYFVWQVSQSTFSIVHAVLYSRTTFRSNSTTSSDHIKLSNLFFFDLDDHSTEFGIFVTARKRINTKFLPIFSHHVLIRVCNCKK